MHSGGIERSSSSLQPIPADLIREIFSRLPAKSVAKFRILSKQWASVLCSRDFAELFRSRSSTRPRILFAAERNGEWLFFSSPQPQNPNEESVTVDYHTKFSGDVSYYNCSYASGLVYFLDMCLTRDKESPPVVCNPITGMYVSLPHVMFKRSRGFLGFEPVDKQFKVFNQAQIMTLGIGELRWREIDCCPGRSSSGGICIDGVLYYLTETFRILPRQIVRYDLRSEEFNSVDAECFNDDQVGDDDTSELVLVNYNGKLGVIDWKYGQSLRVWVLEDFEKSEWLKRSYTLPDNEALGSCEFSVSGVTSRGEILLCSKYTCNPFYIFYFNPKKNTLRSVQVQGFGANLEADENRGTVYAFVDYVEDLSVNDAKQLKSSISEVKHLCSCCDKVAQPNYNYQKA